jgi:excisionase family DNA binding protein
MDDELMTSGEAAASLQVTPQRIAELGHAGKLPRQRVGKFWLYRRSDLDASRTAPKSKGGRPRKLSPQLPSPVTISE